MRILNQVLVWCLPFIPKAFIKPFAWRYVAGETVQEMLMVVRRLNAEGCMATIDVLGEFIHDVKEAQQAADLYKEVLQRIADERLNANISVKLSQMGLLLDKNTCYDLMNELVTTAAKYRIFVRIDMEDSACTSDTIAIYLKLRKQHENVGLVLQAYLRRTLQDVRQIARDLDKIQAKPNFRLCKGIYVEPRALAWKHPVQVHKNYALILEEMFKKEAYVGIATHHEDLVWEALRLIDQYRLKPDEYEFQMLYGVDPALRQILLQQGHRVRVYVPFGRDWLAYSKRRFKENPQLVGYVVQNLFKRG